MKTITINSIDELTEIILSKQFSDNQIKMIVEKALTVIFINDLPPREELAEMVSDFLNKYSRKEHPLFFGELNLDVID